MSYDAVDRVIKSSIEEPGEFCVLLALAHCFNAETGECFPSTATIAKLARKSPRVVRQAIQALEQRGIISCKQSPGGVRRFTLSFDAIPLSETQPLSKTQGGTKTTVLSETTVHPCRKGQGTPDENARGPLSKTTAEQGIEQVSKQVTEQVINTRTSSTSAEESNGSLPEVLAFITDVPSSESYSEVASTSGGSSVSDCGSAVSSREDTFELTPNEPPAKPAPKKGAKRSNLAARPDDVSEEVWKDYQTLRKAKRAPVTDTVINGLRREAGAAGITLEQAMTFCIERGYQGFKADWYKNAANVGGRPQRDTTRFAHEWRQEDRVYVTDEKMEEMRKTLAMFKEKKSA